jgi:hypothetical protein
MTPKKQVSPAIRILRGKRDASARATHLEAATRKFLVTTNERKQMSTKTHFKRIALVAVAALGMGVLSSVPSNATIVPANITLSTTAGTATTGQSDSSTGAIITATWLASATTDSMSITVASKSKPAAQSNFPKGWLTVIDTAGSVNAGAVQGIGNANGQRVTLDSLTATAGNLARDSYTAVDVLTGTANTYTTLKLKLHAAIDANGLAAGSYVYTVTATPSTASAYATTDAKSIDVTITVAANDAVASAAYSTAVLSAGATSFVAPTPGTDSSVAVSAVASSTSKAVMRVTLASALNVSTYTAESVTVTTNVGSVGSASGTSIGKSVTFRYVAGSPLDVFIFADGTAGTATINVSTTSVTFPAKTVTFYSTTVSKITAVQGTKTIAVGANSATSNTYGYAPIWAKAVDANGLTVRADADGAASVYAYSSDLTVISDSGTACAYNSTLGYNLCPLTGLKAGTATITLRNVGTGQTAGAILSNAITVKVATASAATIKLAFDKATYAPGERAFLKLTALDSAGNSVAPGTIAALLATGGITSSASFTNLYYSGATQTALPTSTEVALAHYVKSISPNNWSDSDEPAFIIAMNMPTGGSSVSVSATGGTAVASAGRVAVTATATITDSGAAALAAVQALATTVASLKTLITTLTNLVLKIQKKVKA